MQHLLWHTLIFCSSTPPRALPPFPTPLMLIPRMNTVLPFFCLICDVFVTDSSVVYVSSCPELLPKYKPIDTTLWRPACFVIKASDMKEFPSCDSNLFPLFWLTHQYCNHEGTETICLESHTCMKSMWAHSHVHSLSTSSKHSDFIY